MSCSLRVTIKLWITQTRIASSEVLNAGMVPAYTTRLSMAQRVGLLLAFSEASQFCTYTLCRKSNPLPSESAHTATKSGVRS